MSLRLSRDWWLVFLLVPFGWMSWASFLYAGVRARRPLWLATGGAYLLITVVAMAIISTGDGTAAAETYDGIGTVLSLLMWIASFAHVLEDIRPELYSRIELREATERRQLETDAARDLVRRSPEQARALGVGRPDLPGARHCGLIDLNGAPPEVLAGIPGLDEQTVEQIAQLRPFSSVEDLGSALDLPPQVVEELRVSAVLIGR